MKTYYQCISKFEGKIVDAVFEEAKLVVNDRRIAICESEEVAAELVKKLNNYEKISETLRGNP